MKSLLTELSALSDQWIDMQIEYERIASEKDDARHAAKFNGKALATRDCRKQLDKILTRVDTQ